MFKNAVKRKANNRVRYTDELHDLISDQNKALLRQFGVNIRTLRVYCGLSSEALSDELKMRYGFETKKQNIRLLENNDIFNFSLMYLATFAVYFNIPMIDLFNKDYSIEANIPDHIKGRFRVNNMLNHSIERLKNKLDQSSMVA